MWIYLKKIFRNEHYSKRERKKDGEEEKTYESGVKLAVHWEICIATIKVRAGYHQAGYPIPLFGAHGEEMCTQSEV